MKNKEAISVIVGTAFFTIPYLALSVSVLPSLLIGVSAYGASELLFSETKKIQGQKNTTKSINNVLNKARENNKELIKLSKVLNNEETTASLIEITVTINKIIDTVDKKHSKFKNIDNLFDYYLPILVKIVTRYDEIENQELSSKEGKKFIESADNMIKEANDSFKKLLDSLYQSDIVDADAEMKVFNTMLKSDGLSNEIEIKGKE